MLIHPQFLCWGPNIVNLVCQSPSGFGDDGELLTRTAALHYGFGRHLEVLGAAGLFRWFKFLYTFEFLYTLAMASVKYSMYMPFTLPQPPHAEMPPHSANCTSDNPVLQHPLPIPHLPYCPISPHPPLVQSLRRLLHHLLRLRLCIPMRTHPRFLGHSGWHTHS